MVELATDSPHKPRWNASARHERLGLILGIGGNLLGAASGIVMYLHSRSDALLLDGLYTGVLAASGLVALKVSQAALAPRSRAYPFGAAGQEPLYVLFQSLVMIGMVVFAGVGAIGKVIAATHGDTAPAVELSGLNWYFSAMVLLNLVLWWQYRRSWRLSGGSSEVLLGSSNSALFDAAISAGTGIVLVGSPLLSGKPLASIIPVTDSVVVLVLSALFLPAPLRDLRRAVAESAGVSVHAALHQRCQDALTQRLAEEGCTLLELAMIKLGRTFTVVAYIDTASPLRSIDVDKLRHEVDTQMQQLLKASVLCEVIPTTEHPYVNNGNPV